MQKVLPAVITCVRHASGDSTDLKGILADKIPKEQARIKDFRKSHGATKVGEVTVDMVSFLIDYIFRGLHSLGAVFFRRGILEDDPMGFPMENWGIY